MVEAQGCALPVVCPPVGGVPETYVEGETGFGVSPAAPEGFADMVSKLIENPDLRLRMANNAFHHARTNFSVGRMVVQTLDVYRRAKESASHQIQHARGVA